MASSVKRLSPSKIDRLLFANRPVQIVWFAWSVWSVHRLLEPPADVAWAAVMTASAVLWAIALVVGLRDKVAAA